MDYGLIFWHSYYGLNLKRHNDGFVSDKHAAFHFT